MENFQNHFIFLFDLKSLQDAAEQLHYSELNGEGLKLEKRFFCPFEQVTKDIVLGERLSNFQIDKFGTIAKFFSFFEFLSFYKKLQFLGVFIVIAFVLSINFYQT